MYRTASAALALLTLSSSPSAVAEGSRDDFPTDSGGILMLCEAPTRTSSAADDAVFLELFPGLMANLKARTRDGTVLRAHFLGDLDDGLLIIVGGDSRGDALERALALRADNERVIRAAHAELGVAMTHDVADLCRLVPIGPAAALP